MTKVGLYKFTPAIFRLVLPLGTLAFCASIGVISQSCKRRSFSQQNAVKPVNDKDIAELIDALTVVAKNRLQLVNNTTNRHEWESCTNGNNARTSYLEVQRQWQEQAERLHNSSSGTGIKISSRTPTPKGYKPIASTEYRGEFFYDISSKYGNTVTDSSGAIKTTSPAKLRSRVRYYSNVEAAYVDQDLDRDPNSLSTLFRGDASKFAFADVFNLKEKAPASWSNSRAVVNGVGYDRFQVWEWKQSSMGANVRVAENWGERSSAVIKHRLALVHEDVENFLASRTGLAKVNQLRSGGSNNLDRDPAFSRGQWVVPYLVQAQDPAAQVRTIQSLYLQKRREFEEAKAKKDKLLQAKAKDLGLLLTNLEAGRGLLDFSDRMNRSNNGDSKLDPMQFLLRTYYLNMQMGAFFKFEVPIAEGGNWASLLDKSGENFKPYFLNFEKESLSEDDVKALIAGWTDLAARVQDYVNQYVYVTEKIYSERSLEHNFPEFRQNYARESWEIEFQSPNPLAYYSEEFASQRDIVRNWKAEITIDQGIKNQPVDPTNPLQRAFVSLVNKHVQPNGLECGMLKMPAEIADYRYKPNGDRFDSTALDNLRAAPAQFVEQFKTIDTVYKLRENFFAQRDKTLLTNTKFRLHASNVKHTAAQQNAITYLAAFSQILNSNNPFVKLAGFAVSADILNDLARNDLSDDRKVFLMSLLYTMNNAANWTNATDLPEHGGRKTLISKIPFQQFVSKTARENIQNIADLATKFEDGNLPFGFPPGSGLLLQNMFNVGKKPGDAGYVASPKDAIKKLADLLKALSTEGQPQDELVAKVSEAVRVNSGSDW